MAAGSGKTTAFWQQYQQGRPVVPDSFFENIFEYHTNHGGKLDLLHEAGAGPGIHTARLAPHFTKAIISDVEATSIKTAKGNLIDLENCEFTTLALEDSKQCGTVDMVVCLNMLHLCNFERSLQAIYGQLKSGGTFVYGFFAWPAFPDNKHAQAILERMCKRGLQWLQDVKGRELKEPLGLFVSNGDKIPSTGFSNIIRRRINFPEDFTWRKQLVFDGLELDPWPEPKRDEVEFLQDDGWKFELDYDGLRENLASHPWGCVPDLLDDLWIEMKGVMGGQKIAAVWPVTCVLATRA